jgi:titin
LTGTLLTLATLVVLLGLAQISHAAPKIFTVNTTDDTVDSSGCNTQHCSIREAIIKANSTGDLDYIYFDIAGTAPYTISVTSALPPINQPVIIDGTTEDSFVDKPVIVLDGSSAGIGANGLHLVADSITVKSLVIHSFTPYGILIEAAGGNTIVGNFIGTNASGSIARGNSGAGILIDRASNNTIGGTAAADRNLISGNAGLGVIIQGAGSTTNIIQGNYVGTDLNGTIAVPNEGSGIFIDNAPYNTVGGTVTGARNVVSGNGNAGVTIQGAVSTENLVQGNYIGTNAGGTSRLPNTKAGVTINDAPNNTIGGSASGAGNLISGNGEDGVHIMGVNATGNVVLGNYIGTNHDGSAALGNQRHGVIVDQVSQNTVGGTTAAERNIISGNAANGVAIKGTTAISNTVRGNYIGTDASGIAAVPNSASGVLIESAPNNTIGGTAISDRNLIAGNGADGIFILGSSSSGNRVQGNYIGTTFAGNAALANNENGVKVFDASLNLIGGTVAGAGNLISGNGHDGVWIGGGATGNILHGNRIGTIPAGTVSLGNNDHGIEINEAPGNTIGGTTDGQGNLISGNSHDGVHISGASASNNVVQGNKIGTTAGGIGSVPNDGAGLSIEDAPNNSVGGPSAAERNLISGNGTSGVYIKGPQATGTRVTGNYIGTKAAGTDPLPNQAAGVLIENASHNSIGGSSVAERNLISGNGGAGVKIESSLAVSNTVMGNYIGTDLNGTAALPNLGSGVEIVNASGNAIGGLASTAGNLIAFNSQDGVTIHDDALTPDPRSSMPMVPLTATGNLVQGNSIFANGGLGIDLGGDGVTPNDPQDPDLGPNLLQNYPVLTLAGTDYDTLIMGTLDSLTNTTFVLELYNSDNCNSSGYGEGAIYLGHITATTTMSGNVSFHVRLSTTLPISSVVTATATDPELNTSEFSACETVKQLHQTYLPLVPRTYP